MSEGCSLQTDPPVEVNVRKNIAGVEDQKEKARTNSQQTAQPQPKIVVGKRQTNRETLSLRTHLGMSKSKSLNVRAVE